MLVPSLAQIHVAVWTPRWFHQPTQNSSTRGHSDQRRMQRGRGPMKARYLLCQIKRMLQGGLCIAHETVTSALKAAA